ncbi:hypothetical protein HDU76_000902, partial [Blyttiomyces sp. JEL0837]
FIHGFLGSDESFESFPEHLISCLAKTHGIDREDVEAKVFPRFDTKGNNSLAVKRLADWLLLNATTLEYSITILCAHSMGGLMAADSYALLYDLLQNKIQNQEPPKETASPKTPPSSWLSRSFSSLTSFGFNSTTTTAKTKTISEPAALTATPTTETQTTTTTTMTTTTSKTMTTVTTRPEVSAEAVNEASVPGSTDANLDAAPESKSQEPPPDADATDESKEKEAEHEKKEAEIRHLVNIRGVLTFDSPFFGLAANVITSAGTNKVLSAINYAATAAGHFIKNPANLPIATLLKNPAAIQANLPNNLPAGWSSKDDTMSPTVLPAWLEEEGPLMIMPAGEPVTGSNVLGEDSDVQQQRELESQVAAISLAQTNATKVQPENASTEFQSANAGEAKPASDGWRNVAKYALIGAGAAAAVYTTAGILPIVARAFPVTSVAQGMATKWALSQVEEARRHAEFLYPLVNSTDELSNRVNMLKAEMELKDKVHFHGFYLELPPLVVAKPEKTTDEKKPVNDKKNDEKGVEETASVVGPNTPQVEVPMTEQASASETEATDQTNTEEASTKPTPILEDEKRKPSIDETPKPDSKKELNINKPRNFCIVPPSFAEDMFSKVGSPMADEIDAHMHLFSREFNGNFYFALVEKTAVHVKFILDHFDESK